MKIDIARLEWRQLLRNLVSLSTLQLASFMLPLLTLPHQVRYLGVENFGRIALAAAVVAYFKALVDYGFDLTAARDVAQNKENNSAISEVFFHVFYTKLVLCFFSSIVFLATLSIYPISWHERALFFCSFLIVPLSVTSTEWLFHGLQKMTHVAIIGVFTKAIACVGIISMVRSPADYLYVPVILFASTAVHNLFCAIIAISSGTVQFVRWPGFGTIALILRREFDAFIGLFMPNLYSNLSVVMLGAYGTSSNIAHFDVARKLSSVGEQVINVASRAIYPILCSNISFHRLFVYVIMSGVALGSFVLAAFSGPIIVFLFGEDYSSAIYLLRILSFSLLFFALSRLYGTNFLLIGHRRADFRRAVIFGSLTGFVSAVLLVPTLHAIGAAITLVVARAAMSFSAIYYAKKAKILTSDPK